MKCYVHHAQDAVGICKACGKALCPECAVDLKFAISCKGPCEEKATLENELLEKAKRTYAAHRKNHAFMPLFFMFMGVLFTVWGMQDKAAFPIAMGSGFIVFGIVYWVVNRKWAKQMTTGT